MKTFRCFLLLLFMSVPCAIHGNTIYFPQVAFGGGYTTTFAVMNTGTITVASHIYLYNQSGVKQSAHSIEVSIPAGGSKRFTLPDNGPLMVGWGELAAGNAIVQGVATFDLRDKNGLLITTTGVLGVEAADRFLLPADVTSLEATGVALANIKAENSATVLLRLLGEDGQYIATSTDVRLNPLAARHQIASFVYELFPQLAGTNFKGTLVVEAAPGTQSNSLIATALTLKEGLLSALPVIPPGYPIFQSDLISAAVGLLGVSSNNRRAGVSVTIENNSKETQYLAFQSGTIGLTDNYSTDWISYSPKISGIQVVSSNYDSTKAKQSDFTAISPSERITTVIMFESYVSGSEPGNSFSLGLQGMYNTLSGLKKISIGFPKISIGTQMVVGQNNYPVYQSDLIKGTIGQLSVSSNNKRAGMSVLLENISKETLYLAFQRGTASLTDNLGTNWTSYSPEIRGIQVVYDSVSVKQEDFTAIAPSECITVVITFDSYSSGETPGTSFSFSVQGTYYTSSGLKKVSIGLPLIKP